MQRVWRAHEQWSTPFALCTLHFALCTLQAEEREGGGRGADVGCELGALGAASAHSRTRPRRVQEQVDPAHRRERAGPSLPLHTPHTTLSLVSLLLYSFFLYFVFILSASQLCGQIRRTERDTIDVVCFFNIFAYISFSFYSLVLPLYLSENWTCGEWFQTFSICLHTEERMNYRFKKFYESCKSAKIRTAKKSAKTPNTCKLHTLQIILKLFFCTFYDLGVLTLS